MRTLSAAIGRYKHTARLLAGEVVSDTLRLAFADYPLIYRAFAPMIREAKFDVSEIAIATFIQAKAFHKPFILLPVAVAARYQEAALLCRADSPIHGPADLRGRRIGVRSYGQTTGMWLRGVLQNDWDLPPEAMQWITFEDPHVPEFRDPAFASRAAPGSDIVGMLRAGEIDAAILGNELPDGPEFRTVFPDPAAAGAAFQARYGFKPVNHLICIRSEHAAHAAELMRMLIASGPPPLHGRDAIRPSVELAVRFCAQQSMLPRAVAEAELYA